jgi:biopolymer transport protein ExbD
MKLKPHSKHEPLDMTPMIDISFLLISFFMVAINFTEADQNERIKLPTSELARPPETPLAEPLVIQVLQDGNAIFAGNEYNKETLSRVLDREMMFFKQMDVSAKDITVILRADARCPTGLVRDIVEMCQEKKLENFKFRAKQKGTY